ncbi:HD domain-containing protein [Candidatus Woesearchaeota archaeon]|nr:HD domain-containing protein [Candidatus Woesearchaeota archaeon]
MDKLKKVEEIVKASCLTSKRFKAHKFQWAHVQSVRKFAIELAKKLNADIEIVDMAALLHDIGRVRYSHEDHEKTSAEDSEKILKELDYPNEFIKKVIRAVLTHRGSALPEPETTEEKIVACADAMSHFDNLLTLFYVYMRDFEKTPEEAREWTVGKIEKAWRKVCKIPEAKELLEEKYKAAKLIFADKIQWD